MKTLCKFKCIGKESWDGELITVKFNAVKDEVFGPYTPAGNIQLDTGSNRPTPKPKRNSGFDSALKK